LNTAALLICQAFSSGLAILMSMNVQVAHVKTVQAARIHQLEMGRQDSYVSVNRFGLVRMLDLSLCL
jgi:hypothetical protein